MTVDTTRRLGDDQAAVQRINHNRSRRLRQGDIFLRRCVVLFMASLTGVLKTRQYSVEYYCCWAMTYISIFFLLPSVLPTDNTRIRVVLLVLVWNMGCASVFAVRYCLRKLTQPCDLERWMCTFNAGFWAVHAIVAFAMSASSLYSMMRRSPEAGLHRFWWDFGCYFILLSIVSTLDTIASSKAGKFETPQYRVAFWGNVVLSSLQFCIGALCHSNRFKLAVWRYAASVASITVRRHNSRGGLPSLCSCFLPSAVIIFILAVLGVGYRG